MKKIIKHRYFPIVLAVVVGVLVGWIIKPSSDHDENTDHQHDASADHDVWTCAMHPHIRQDKPGQCPICGMDLTLVNDAGAAVDNTFIYQMTEEAMALANVQTSEVRTAEEASKEMYLTGKMEADERKIYEIPAHFHGRIEKLHINFTGDYVSKGKVLASVYSPDLITAQQELKESIPYKESNPALYRAARNKLKNWKIADSEIDNLEESGVVRTVMPIRAHQAGVVRQRHVSVGDHVSMGDILFEVVDLSHLWVMLDAYEQHLAQIKVGDLVEFTVASMPGESYEAKVTFIDPFIDPQTRVARVRAEINNPDGKLKPEMFVRAMIKSKASGGTATDLMIPQTAVLWTGKRSLVYVKDQTLEQPTFEYREVTLGPLAGDYFMVESGLSQGELVVTNGTFSIDAAAQLSGKASMMNPEGGKVSTGHDHGNMNSSSSSKGSTKEDHSRHNQGDGAMNLQIDAGFKDQLLEVFSQYQLLKDDFVENQSNRASQSAGLVTQSLLKVDMNRLKGPAHDEWMKQSAIMFQALKEISDNSDLNLQRKAFSHLSDALYQSIKRLQISGFNAYYQFCPMAYDSGAHWLSLSEDIKNPYFGSAMLSCGETIEKLN